MHTPSPTCSHPLRIAVASFPSLGGSGKVASELGRALAHRGHEVHFLCYEQPAWIDAARDRLQVHRVLLPDYPLPNLGAYPLALSSSLSSLCERVPIDLIHLHYAIPHTTSAYLAKQILSSRGLPVPKLVTTLHGTDVTLVGSDPALLPIHRFTLDQCDGLTSPSDYLRQTAYRALGLSSHIPFSVIPNFVDAAHFSPAKHPLQRRSVLSGILGRELSLTESDTLRVLLHSSNFRPVKRIDDLLTLTQTLRNELPVLLLLIGDGPERPRLEQKVRERGLSSSVYFLGQQLDFVSLLRQSDVFVLPSELEGFGLSALEALSCGVPVVASNVGGLPEVISDGQTGFLHPVGDTATMTSAVRKLLTDENLWADMSQAARHSVEQSFQRDPLVLRYEELFLSLCRPSDSTTWPGTSNRRSIF